MPLSRNKQNLPPISEAEISMKAYEIWQARQVKGILGSGETDWQQAKELLEREQLTKLSVVKKAWAIATYPARWTEKRVIEPLANWLDQADIFRIVEKVSPALEAIGVIMIPVVIWWMTDTGQKAKEETDKAARAQEAVKTYLNQLSTVFLDGNLEKDERLRIVTQASTLALFSDPNLEGTHKGKVIDYLAELKLIQVEMKESAKESKLKTPIISLAGADLRDAHLSHANLSGINLSGAFLTRTSLNESDLSGANLSGAFLNDAYAVSANLSGANLSGASFSEIVIGTDFIVYSGANLIDVDLSGADLSSADLGATDLRGANLRGANLGYANLKGANLSGVGLVISENTDLRDADLRYANLADADLTATLVKNAQFGGNWDLSETEKRDLIQRGAIFDETLGDHSSTHR
jgi:uncharacterized protein YjbI with pentapeptide repeats